MTIGHIQYGACRSCCLDENCTNEDNEGMRVGIKRAEKKERGMRRGEGTEYMPS